MKPEIKFNRDYAFFIFVSFTAGFLFALSGISLLSSFLTGIFIYVFLRFMYFVWGILTKFFDRGNPNV